MTTPSASASAPASGAAAAAAADAFLSIEHLSKRFDEVTAVDQVSLQIARGEIFALLGPSGCGKSTLLRMLAGFENPSEGRILLAGHDITALAPYDRPINMMFQSYALFPHLSVADNVAFGLKRQGLPKARVKERVDALLSMVQLGPLARRKPHQLSGGQQQRVALARSLALEPSLLLLDEPLGALDRKLRSETQFELKSILKRVGVTCVLVTHDQEEAMILADRIAVLDRGTILQVGSPKDIYETPCCRFVADFIGNVNLVEGQLAEDEPDYCVIETGHGRFRVGHGISGVLGMALGIAIRPEKIALHEAGRPDVNRFKGVVVDTTYFGAISSYRVRLDSGLVLQVSESNSRRHEDPWPAGSHVDVVVADDAMVVLTS
jgi:putrescine transport system ATP-binding protein